MPTGKTSTLTFRIAPALKEALRTAAVREHRSIANMVEASNDIPSGDGLCSRIGLRSASAASLQVRRPTSS
jgi:hypothetical protein